MNSDLQKTAEDIKKVSEDADFILVGFGREWYSNETPEITAGDGISREEAVRGYEKIRALIGDKKHYIITLAYDDVIYDVFNGEDEKIVAPCGTKRLLQCKSHLMSPDEVKDTANMVCPVCGEKLVYNNILAEGYMEEGYLDEFEKYKKFLQTTVNKKLLILEFGVDMKYPSVIRFPFDKLCVYNYKSSFYRINDSFPQHVSETYGRGISVKTDSVYFVNNYL